jgi:hypothetical protein
MDEQRFNEAMGDTEVHVDNRGRVLRFEGGENAVCGLCQKSTEGKHVIYTDGNLTVCTDCHTI